MNFLIVPLSDSEPLPAFRPMADRTRAEKARSIYSFRQRRQRHMPAELLGEPGWDILLLAYFLSAEGRRVSIGDLSNGAGVAPTTGLRWVRSLEKRGFLERSPDVDDKRRQFLSLTPKGQDTMDQILDAYL